MRMANSLLMRSYVPAIRQRRSHFLRQFGLL